VIGSSQGGEEEGYDNYTPFFGEKNFKFILKQTEPSI
jgi:hypothetical protein